MHRASDHTARMIQARETSAVALVVYIVPGFACTTLDDIGIATDPSPRISTANAFEVCKQINLFPRLFNHHPLPSFRRRALDVFHETPNVHLTPRRLSQDASYP